jgi:transketolase
MTSSLAQVKEVYGKTLVELGDRNPDIFAVEADLMKASGTAPFKERFPDRHINVGVAEQNLVGVAAGIASTGRVPFACTMANFMSQRACDQVAMSVAFNQFNVKLVGCYAGLTQEKNGATHISIMDLAITRALPNMKVIVPADCREFAQALAAVSEDVGPTYLRMAKLLPESVLGDDHQFQIGRAYQFEEGSDLTVISTGLTTSIALQALPALKKQGIEARVIHLPTLKPADRNTILASARATGAIITIENHSVLGGLGGLVSEIVTSEYPVTVRRLGINDQFGLTAGLEFQLKYFGLTVEDIVKNAREILNKPK